MMRLTPVLTALAAWVALTTSGAPAGAETNWPSKPITVVIPFEPGGGMDQTLLPMKPLLEQSLDTSILSAYKPGAGSQIGLEFVHAMGGDGHTIGGFSLPHLPNTLVFSEPDYTLDDLAPVAILTGDVPIWFTHKDSPYRDMNDLIAAARERPGEVTVAIGSFTGEHYVTVALLEQQAGIEFNVVNVKGGGKVMSNVVGRHFDVGVSRPGSITPVQDQVRGLGVVAAKRALLWENTPTFDEQLPDGIEIPHLTSARGFFASAQFREDDPEGFAKLVAAVDEAAHSDAFKEALSRQGLELDYQGPDQAAATIRSTFDLMGQFQGVIEAAQSR